MTERLTVRYGNSFGTQGCLSGCDTCSWCECKYAHNMIAKLAHYEDLEEQCLETFGLDIASMVTKLAEFCKKHKEGKAMILFRGDYSEKEGEQND